MGGIFIDIFELDDVGMTKFFYYLYLIFQHFQTGGWVFFQLDDFYREIPLPLGTSAFVDVARVPRTYFIALSIGIMADRFEIIFEADCLLAWKEVACRACFSEDLMWLFLEGVVDGRDLVRGIVTLDHNIVLSTI